MCRELLLSWEIVQSSLHTSDGSAVWQRMKSNLATYDMHALTTLWLDLEVTTSLWASNASIEQHQGTSKGHVDTEIKRSRRLLKVLFIQ